MRIALSLLTLLTLLAQQPALADEMTKATVYKDPSCGCCHEYVGYLRQNGFDVEVVDTGDLMSIKQQAGVPAELEAATAQWWAAMWSRAMSPPRSSSGCCRRSRRSAASAAGMPQGSPGMDGAKEEPFVHLRNPEAQEFGRAEVDVTE